MDPNFIESPQLLEARRQHIPVARTFVHFSTVRRTSSNHSGTSNSSRRSRSLSNISNVKKTESSHVLQHDHRLCPRVEDMDEGEEPVGCQCQCWHCQIYCRYESIGVKERLGKARAKRASAASAPRRLDLGFALRLQRLRLVRRFAATTFPVSLGTDGTNMKDLIKRWNFWNDIVHATVLVNESHWRSVLCDYEAKAYPHYLPAPLGATAKPITERISAAKRATTEVLGLGVCNLYLEPAEVESTSQSAPGEWSRLVWQPPSKSAELWPVTLGKRGRPKQLQGRLRRELEPRIWVRVDVQRCPGEDPPEFVGRRDAPENLCVWEQEQLVRCQRTNDKIERHDGKQWEHFHNEQNVSTGDIRSVLSLAGVPPILSSQSLLLLPPLSSFSNTEWSRVPRLLGMEPLSLSDGGLLAVPKSLLEAPLPQNLDHQSFQSKWLCERRVTVMLGGCEDEDF